MARNDFFLTGTQGQDTNPPKQFGAEDFLSPNAGTNKVPDIFMPNSIPSPNQAPIAGRPFPPAPAVNPSGRSPSMSVEQFNRFNEVQGRLDAKEQAAQKAGIASELDAMGGPGATSATPSTIPESFESFTAPSGQGTAFLPPLQKGTGRTAQEIQAGVAGQEQNKLNDQALRQGIQEGKIAEAKDRIGIKASIKSLEDQGMTIDDIRSKIGFREGMSGADALKGLQRLQTSKSRESALTGRERRDADRITQKADRDEQGIASNDAARFEDIDTALDSVGNDPEATKSLRDGMNDSQNREYNRLRSKVASNRARDNDFKRMDKFVNDIKLRDSEKYLKKQAVTAKDVLTLASKKAQTAEDNSKIGAISKLMTAVKARLDDKKSGSKLKGQDRIDAATEYQGYIDQLNGYVEGVADATPRAQPSPTSHQEANKQAKASGSATYLFEGNDYVVQ